MDSLQMQVDKGLGQASRIQKEKESLQFEMDKLKDKCDKSQVSPQQRVLGFDTAIRVSFVFLFFVPELYHNSPVLKS